MFTVATRAGRRGFRCGRLAGGFLAAGFFAGCFFGAGFAAAVSLASTGPTAGAGVSLPLTTSKHTTSIRFRAFRPAPPPTPRLSLPQRSRPFSQAIHSRLPSGVAAMAARPSYRGERVIWVSATSPSPLTRARYTLKSPSRELSKAIAARPSLPKANRGSQSSAA